MRPKITNTMLETLADAINRQMKTPADPYTIDETGVFRAQVGCYHISRANGGNCLHQISNESGGCRDVLYCGHIGKRDLYDQMYAFLKGLDEARRATTEWDSDRKVFVTSLPK